MDSAAVGHPENNAKMGFSGVIGVDGRRGPLERGRGMVVGEL